MLIGKKNIRFTFAGGLARNIALYYHSLIYIFFFFVGGPARNIARFSGADITGITLNDYQVQRGNAKCAREGLAGSVRLVQVCVYM